MSGGEALTELSRAWGLRRRIAGATFALGIGGLIAATAWRGGAHTVTAFAFGAAGAIAAGIIARRLFRSTDAATVARHVDRALPQAEESAELLLREPSAIPLFDRLQRGRVEAALAGTTLRLPPDRLAARAAISGVAALVASTAVLLIPSTSAPSAIPGAKGDPGAVAPPELLRASVEIRPPRYTGRPARRQEALEIDAEEGAEIRWALQISGTARAPRILTSVGDTIRLTSDRDGSFVARMTAARSLLYQVALDSIEDPAEIHRVIVRPDVAPEVTVLRPAPRTELPAGTSLRVPIDVLVTDDYGAASAEVVATVTTGSGESVRFREQRIRLPAPSGGSRIRSVLDLAALGMTPGDELYFHVLARDRRPRAPNTGRSATVFLALADTAAQSPPLIAGVALPVAPEYFRSQRQIIIDTERLVADAPRLPTGIFRERSNATGIDQGLLRLRYGEFTGEEFEAEVEAGETHDHDSEENATLLAPSVKATLKAAIAQMWEAELRLRTYRPKEALPFEYRALELLKSVQQSSRAYVQRVGFEPPPLEIDRRRLTGNLAGVRSRTSADSTPAEDERKATRAALAVLRELGTGIVVTAADRADLAAAEDELSRLAIADEAAHLEALRRLRTLRASLREGRACEGCIAGAEAALLASLPPPPPGAAPRNAGGELARRYAEILGRPR